MTDQKYGGSIIS